MSLNQWAIKHGVSTAALNELRAMMGIVNTDPTGDYTSHSEAALQNRLRLEASQKGARLWRNNIGAMYDETGRFIRYGLANDSERMNKIVKSSDLIGLRPVLITPQMVGSIIGQFIAREVKAGNWCYKGTEREQAQLNFLNIVLSLGGDAAFANSEGTL